MLVSGAGSVGIWDCGRSEASVEVEAISGCIWVGFRGFERAAFQVLVMVFVAFRLIFGMPLHCLIERNWWDVLRDPFDVDGVVVVGIVVVLMLQCVCVCGVGDVTVNLWVPDTQRGGRYGRGATGGDGITIIPAAGAASKPRPHYHHQIFLLF